MAKELVPRENPFEFLRQEDEEGEYWLAREMQSALGYNTWKSFEPVLKRAVMACRNSQINPNEHFVGTRKMVKIGSNAAREIIDYRLSRYACYILAMNGDPFNVVVANAQTYFAAKAREAEILQKQLISIETKDIDVIMQQLAEIKEEISKMNVESEKKGFSKAIDQIISGTQVKNVKWTE